MSMWTHINGIICVDAQYNEDLVEEIKERYSLGDASDPWPFLPFKAFIDSALKQAPKIHGSEGDAKFKIIDEASGITCFVAEEAVSPIDWVRVYVGASLRDTGAFTATDEFIRWLKFMRSVFYGSLDINIEFLCIKDYYGTGLLILDDKIIEAKDGVAEKVKPLLDPEED